MENSPGAFTRANLTDRPIGVFDSGMGGLTVLAALTEILPEEDFIYLGDTARVPYGSRSPATVQRYSREVADYLISQNIKMLVIACNTATAYAESILAEELTTRQSLEISDRSGLSVPVLGVIRPGVQAMLKRSHNRRLGVIGTRATIRSEAYEKEIEKQAKGVTVFSRACPLFVPLVEEGWVDKKITSLVIHEYLSEMVREDVDTIVLGCTHYPILKKSITREFPQIELIDSSVETASETYRILKEMDLLRRNEENKEISSKAGRVRLLMTDITDQTEPLSRLFFAKPFHSLEQVSFF